jgi:hypothetical protein
MPDIHLNGIEAFWLAINSLTFAITVVALLDALSDRKAVKLLNGHAREITSRGNVRREVLRLVVQSLLLAAIFPSAFLDNQTPLTPAVLALITVPVVLLGNSILDTLDRKALAATVMAALVTSREAHDSVMERAIEAQGEQLARYLGPAAQQGGVADKSTVDRIEEKLDAGETI